MYYTIKFPTLQMDMGEDYHDTGTIAFSINEMKSRSSSVVEVVLKTYLVDGSISQTLHYRWVVGEAYETYFHNFTVNNPNKIKFVKIELNLFNITSEHPLWFTECMLSNKEYTDDTEYHIPNELMKDLNVGFSKNMYANFYGEDGVFLQVIRPDKQQISTTLLPRTDQCTILAPHIENESEWDNPINIFYEVMNQKEQTINIEK